MTLYDHQRKAISEMKNGCILCGNCGSGKSLTALAYFFTKELNANIEPDIQSPKIKKDLYIITTAKKRNDMEWETELNRFLLTTNKKNESYWDINCVVDSWNNIVKYKDVKNAFFIFDEQRVVGYGVWAKTFINIARNNHWILLSATPGDTWLDYIPVFIANGFYKNKSDFEKKHIIYSRFTRFPSVYKYLDVDHLIKIKKSILVYMPYKKITKTHDKMIFCGYDKELYQKVIKERWNPFKDKPIKSSTEFTYTLRRVVNSNMDRKIAVLGLAEAHPKIIIFYNFYYELDELKELFQDTDFVIAELNGKKHDIIPKSEKWVYLVQYNAGCEGWNCIETDTIIFYSLQPSWKKQKQAEGRIDRIITPFSDLYYYKLITDSSIDKRILVCLNTKQAFNSIDFAETMGVYDFND